MQRYKGDTKLTPADLMVLKSVHFHPDELPDYPKSTPKDVPLLWSPLSYVLSRKHGSTSTGRIWEKYRQLQELKSNRDEHYRSVFIRKQNGGVRRLEIPDEQLREEQEWICREILSKCKVSPHAYAYIKGRTMRECAEIHAGHDVLIHLDIHDFFGSITEKMVATCLWYKTPYSRQMADFLGTLCCAHKHLPQGGIASPTLSNIVFDLVDYGINSLCARYSCSYSRYADDIFISGNLDDPKELIFKIKRWIESYGFNLNEDKTRVIRQGWRMQVLGMTTNTEKVQVSRPYRRAVRQEVYYLLKFGHLADGVGEAGGVLPYAQRLLGKVSYILQVNPDDAWAREAKMQLREVLRQVQREGDPYLRELCTKRQQLRETLEKVVSKRVFHQVTGAVLEQGLCSYHTADYRTDDIGFYWKWADLNGRYWEYHAVIADGKLEITATYPHQLPTYVLWRVMENHEGNDRYGLWRAQVMVKENLICCRAITEKPLAPLEVAVTLTAIHATMNGVSRQYCFNHYYHGGW